MRTQRIVVLRFLVIGSLGLSGFLPAQTSAQDQQKAMDVYMKAGAVTENHAYLKQFVGMWDVKTTMWMAPGQQPMSSPGTYESRLIMGGRFLEMDFKGMMMGQPFEGMMVIGYDNTLKKYVTFWIDNSSTSFYLTSGVRDAAKNITTETGDWPDPMTGKATKVRQVTRWANPNEFVYEQYMGMPDGKEFKSMELHATRKK